MARPGQRQGQTVIAIVPGMKNDAGTVVPAPEIRLLPDTGRNGVTRPIAIAVIIPVQHQLQDGPVTEAGSGVQRLVQQLLPVLVIAIQRDSRDHNNGLMPRTVGVVQWHRWHLHPCQGARLPAVVIRLVIRDQHSRHVFRMVNVVQQSFWHPHLCPGMGPGRLQTIPSHPAMTGLIDVL